MHQNLKIMTITSGLKGKLRFFIVYFVAKQSIHSRNALKLKQRIKEQNCLSKIIPTNAQVAGLSILIRNVALGQTAQTILAPLQMDIILIFFALKISSQLVP